MIILFWVSIFLLAYTYLGYPFTLWVLTKIRALDLHRSEISPSVSIIITARNEADRIGQKIENTLTLDYPPTLLDVIVASDASDDGTDEIVREYASHGIRLVRSPHHWGKEYAQGLAVGEARGEVLVFTDVATTLEPIGLRRLVENFADSTVGAVSSEDLILDAAGSPTAEGLYVKYDAWIRRLESAFHSLVGLSGSCFAIRNELCKEWSPTLASDFMAAVWSARKGYRAVVDTSVRGKYHSVVSAQIEVRRKVRTFLRGITVLMANTEMLNPFAYGRFAFQLGSHKLLRFVVPFLLLVAFGSSGLLMRYQLYFGLFWGQVGFYSLGILGAIVPVFQRNRVVRVTSYFTMVQWAMLLAWAKYMRGQHQTAWEPSKRPGIAKGGHGSTH